MSSSNFCDHLSQVANNVQGPSTVDMSYTAMSRVLGYLQREANWWLSVVAFMLLCVAVNASVGYSFAGQKQPARPLRCGGSQVAGYRGVLAAIQEPGVALSASGQAPRDTRPRAL